MKRLLILLLVFVLIPSHGDCSVNFDEVDDEISKNSVISTKVNNFAFGGWFKVSGETTGNNYCISNGNRS